MRVQHLQRFFWGLGAVVIAMAALVSVPPAVAAGSQESQAKRKVVKKSQVSQRKQYKRVARRAARPVRLSFGNQAGLNRTRDPLSLHSSVALVVDQETQEVLFSKNEEAVLPIASLTKLMTSLLISEAELPLDEVITITQDDVDTEKGSGSRLRVGSKLTRGELMHLALMSSENRAAHALGRTYPGGLQVFVEMMNAKAQLLGMHDTRFVEPTGLSSKNRSSARDLAQLVDAASEDELISEYSTSPGYQVALGRRKLQFSNTNSLVRNPNWEIGLQKTGYISEAGNCLVMQARVAGRNLIMVFLDSYGKYSRLGDAQRVRRWVESLPAKPAEESTNQDQAGTATPREQALVATAMPAYF